jgi:purine-binding chemotaxis protein CheW
MSKISAVGIDRETTPEGYNAAQDEESQLVVFELSGEFYGVDISAVNTIIRMQEITEIPRSPDFVEGVINLRGSIIPVIDLRKRLGLKVSEPTRASRIIVIEANNQMIGMVVDAVAETIRLPQNAVEPPSPIVLSADVEYVRGIGKLPDRLVVLLDLDKVLAPKEVEAIHNMDKRMREKDDVKAI